MNRSESIKEIAGAMAKAQGSMQMAAKAKLNPHFKSMYADLASLVDAIKAALSSNGIAYSQFPLNNGEKAEVGIETLLMHDSGEWILSDPFFIPVAKLDPQGFGSALTYLRRFSLAAATGNAPDDDDDGNGASKDGIPQDKLKELLDSLDKSKDVTDLREKTAAALSIARAGADVSAHEAIKAHGMKVSARFEGATA